MCENFILALQDTYLNLNAPLLDNWYRTIYSHQNDLLAISILVKGHGFY